MSVTVTRPTEDVTPPQEVEVIMSPSVDTTAFYGLKSYGTIRPNTGAEWGRLGW